MVNAKLGKLQNAKQLRIRTRFMSIKRHMGTNHKVNIEGKEYTPQEISAIILQHLKSYAEIILVKKLQKQLLQFRHILMIQNVRLQKMQEELLVLEVERIINEPTAAALHTV